MKRLSFILSIISVLVTHYTIAQKNIKPEKAFDHYINNGDQFYQYELKDSSKIGNTTAYGLDHLKYLKMFYKKITNVHLKDRKLNGGSLEPGLGDTDFHTIFSNLQRLKYSGDYTMQFCRGVAGDEINQCKKHADFVRSMYDNSKKF